MEWVHPREYTQKLFNIPPSITQGSSHEVVREGDVIAVHHKDGSVALVKGPTRVDASSCKIQRLQYVCAENSEYLRVVYKNGIAEHTRGPVAMLYNPVEMTSIEICDCINVSTGELLVVYSQDDKGVVHRRVIRGATVYMLGPREWLHSFSWHGSSGADKTEKSPNATKFTKLRTTPDKFYFNVRDVRTKDDALITGKIMIFFQLQNIEILLDKSHDPIAVLINGASADIVAFISQLTYEEFVKRTAELSELSTYANLTRQAADVGYQITNVAWRGYKSTSGLQNIHDSAIKRRTELVLLNETELQTQDLADLKLQRDYERAEAVRKMELDNVEHSILMSKLNLTQEDEKRKTLLEQSTRHATESLELELAALKAKHGQEIAELEQLQKNGVNLTEYLIRNEKKTIQANIVEVEAK